MKITTFFSLLVGSIVFSGWGFSSYTAGYEGGLPYVGFMLDTEVKDAIAKATAGAEEGTEGVEEEIPKVIDLTKIEEQYKRLPCANKLFPSVPSWDEVEITGESTDSSIGVKNANQLRGCLAVWWNKEGDSENTKIGNVVWGMSDGEFGTIFLTTVNVVNNKITKKESENLYLLEKGVDESDWKILVDMANGEGSEEDLSLGDEMMDDEEYTQDSGNGWATDEASSSTGKLDWDFVSEFTQNNENEEVEEIQSYELIRSFDEWIKDVSKWLRSEDLISRTDTYYGAFNGYFAKAKGQEQ